jgi:hypothetical protein
MDVAEIAGKALAEYDAAVAKCPVRNPGRRKPVAAGEACPACRALSNEGCGKEAGASYVFVQTVRHLLNQDTDHAE